MSLNATILGQIIAFVLFVLFCMRYIWPPLMSAIEKRQKEISDGLSFSEQAKRDLDLAQINVAAQLKKAKLEAREIIDQANKRKEKILHEAKTEAKREYIRILEQAKAQIDSEYRQAHKELYKQISTLAIAMAEKIIENSVDKAISKNIVDKFIAEL